MRFPSMPVRSGRDATLNFDKLQKRLTEYEQSVASAYRNAAQGILNETNTQVKVDKAVNDPFNRFDLTNGWYLVPSDGYYLATGQTSLKEFTNNVFSEIWVNGVVAARGVQANGMLGSVCSVILSCKAGDHIELHTFQKSGIELKLEVGLSYLNRLNVVRVA